MIDNLVGQLGSQLMFLGMYTAPRVLPGYLKYAVSVAVCANNLFVVLSVRKCGSFLSKRRLVTTYWGDVAVIKA